MDWQIFWTILGGAFGGALVGSLTSVLVTKLNHQNEQQSWIREQRQKLYLQTASDNHELYLTLNRLIDRVRSAHEFRTVPQDVPLAAGELELLDIEISNSAIAVKSHLAQLRSMEFRHRILASKNTNEAFAAYLEAMSENVTTASELLDYNPENEKKLLESRSHQVRAWKRWEEKARFDLGSD